MLLLVSPWGPVWGPRLHLGLQPAPGKHRGKASSGRCDQNLQAQVPWGRCRETLGRKERLEGLQKRGEPGPGILESHTALKSLPRPGSIPLSIQRRGAESSTEGSTPVSGSGRNPCPHQLQHFVHFCLCLAMCPWTSLESPQFPRLCCPVHHLQITKSGHKDRISYSLSYSGSWLSESTQ